MTDRRDARCAMNFVANETSRRFRRLTRMESHTHSRALLPGPVVAIELELHFERRGDAGGGRGERGEEGVALRTHLSAVVALEAIADDAVVVGKYLGVDIFAQTPNEIRGALDVGKEKGQGLNSEIVGETSVGSPVESSRTELRRGLFSTERRARSAARDLIRHAWQS